MTKTQKPPLMRLVTAFTTLALVFTFFGIMPEGWMLRAAAAEYTDSYGNVWTYELDTTGNVKITACTPDSSYFVIPAEINGYEVTNFGASLKGNTTIKTLVMSNNLTTISVNEAFRDCTSLQSVTFSKNLTDIPKNTFNGCTSLYVLKNFSDSVTIRKIGDYAFGGCSSLTYLSLPSSLTSIGEQAFNNCKALAYVEFPDVNHYLGFGYYPFYYCSNLKAVFIPKSVTSMTFSTLAVTPAGNTYNYVSNIYGYSGSSAESYANEHNMNFIAVDVADEAGNYLFPDERGNIWTFVVDNGSAVITGLELADESTTNLTVPSELAGFTVTSIKGGGEKVKTSPFYGTSVCTVNLPETLTSIGEYAFKSCESLQNITIPEGVESIGAYAFCWCTNLWNVYFSGESKLKNMYSNAFSYCSSLSEIYLPQDLKKIGAYAFEGCTALKYIIVPDGIEELNACAFYGCSSLMCAFVPDNINFFSQESVFDYVNKDCVIYGYKGSKAEERAAAAKISGDQTGIAFVDVDDLIADLMSDAKYTVQSSTTYVDNASVSCVSLAAGSQLGQTTLSDLDKNTLVTITPNQAAVPENMAVSGYNLRTLINLKAGSSWSVSGSEAEITGNTFYTGDGVEPSNKMAIIENMIKAKAKYGYETTLQSVVTRVIPIYEETTVRTPGDANDDDVIDLLDVMLMQQYIARWEIDINVSNADVDGDGEVTITDVMLVQQFIAHWNVDLV